MKTSASLSVIVPCYRCKSTIDRAVKSIFNQTIQPAEIILIDDFSNDGTLDLLYKIQSDYKTSWIKVIPQSKNVGPGVARNIGWDLSNEKYIAFLDSDDTWHPQKVEIQYNWMLSNSYASLSSHSFKEWEKNLGKSKLKIKKFTQVKSKKLLLRNIFLTPSVMIKRDLPYRFKAEKRYSEDFLLWCEIILDKNLCFYSETSLFFLHKAPYGESGLSGNLKLMELGELDTYKLLNKSGRISFFSCKVLSAWSIIKYIRRLVIIKFRHLKHN